MSRFFALVNGTIKLSGETFPIKEPLKSLGGRWDSAQRCWTIRHSEEILDQVLALGFRETSDSPQTNTIVTQVGTTLEHVWSVEEFVEMISIVIQKALPGSFMVTGEVSSLRVSNGHVFFDLSDSSKEVTSGGQYRTQSMSCVMWAGKFRALLEKHGDFQLQDGLKIKLQGHCDFRKDSAKISFIVDDIDLEFTKGALALSRQKIVTELRKRNLYDRNRQTRLPFLPLRIGLITADKSRALTDFLDELKRSSFAFEIVFCDANMQGENTSRNVTAAFAELAKREDLDCIILTRGGGSRLDLRWFDDLEIAKSIAYAQVPVVTAIGHFEDVSIADEVSFRAEKTPTAAARFLIERTQNAFSTIEASASETEQKVLRRLAREHQVLARMEETVVGRITRKLATEKEKLSQLETTVKVLRFSIEKTVRKGFALLRDENKQIIAAERFLEKNTLPSSFSIELLGKNTDKPVVLVVEKYRVEEKN